MTHSQANSDAFFVVGIGASAGGVQALESFFSSLPETPNAAFVVVQHLSPDFRSMMAEILQRRTTLTVSEIANEMQLVANQVYVLPPRYSLEIQGYQLRLIAQRRSPTAPINRFFHSLASSLGERAIGILLSGTGSDGTEGLQAIGRAGGVALVQSPETAQFTSMPSSAIPSGLVDEILSPRDLAQAVSDIVRLSTEYGSGRIKIEDPEAIAPEQLRRILDILTERSDIDFSHYKTSTLNRRIAHRCTLSHAANLDAYIHRLATSETEQKQLRQDLLIGATRFFRDPPAWECLMQRVLPQTISDLEPRQQLRVWVSACATGEEAYSMAIAISEALEQANKTVQVKIFATDIDARSLETASHGIYPDTIASDISDEYLEKYFERGNDYYQVRRSLREMLIFAPHDLTKNAGFSRMNLVSCRNVLIYMQPPLQQQVLRLLHFSLDVNGTLLLGSSETLGDLSDEFIPVDAKWKLFSKRRDLQFRTVALNQRPLPAMSQSRDRLPANRGRINRVLTEALKFCFAGRTLTSLLVNRDNHLIHIIYNSGQLLEFPVTGAAKLDVIELVPAAVKVPLSTALHRAKRDEQTVVFKNIQLENNNETYLIDLRVGSEPDNPLLEPYLVVVFEIETQAVGDRPAETRDATTAAQLGDVPLETRVETEAVRQIIDLEYELQQTRENLQVTIEELETTNEEQQATNEELLASNEELQSTNEELQSVNEELYTVNSEYQNKIAELTQLSNDIDNLLRSTEIGVVFLDPELHVRKFTPAATRAINLKPTDIGRSLSDLTNNLADGDDLIASLRAVLTDGQPLDREVAIATTDEQFLMRVNIYNTPEHEHDGLVVTFINIDNLKETQQQLHLTNRLLENLYASTPVGLCLHDADLRFLRINQRLAAINGFSVAEHIGKTSRELMPGIAETVEPLLRQVLETGKPIHNRKVSGTTPAEPEVRRHWLVTYYPVTLRDGQRGVGAAVTDITELERTQAELRTNQQLLQSIADTSPGIVYVCDLTDGNMLIYCSGSAVALGYCEDSDFTLLDQPITDGIHPDDRERTIAELRALGDDPDRAEVTIEYRLRCQDDTYRWFSSSNRIFSYTESGRVETVVGVALDMSDRMAAEMARRESEERFQAFMSHTPSLSWITSAEGQLLYANAAYQTVLSCPLELAIGRHLRELFAPEDAERYLAADRRVLAEGEASERIDTVELDGQRFEYLVYAFPIYHPGDRPDCVGGVAIDITARREAERLLAASNETLETRVAEQMAALHDREISLVNLAASLPGAAYRRQLDAERTMVWLSDFATEITGYAAHELVQNRDRSFNSLLHADDRPRVSREIAAALSANEPFECEYRLLHRDGQQRWVYDRGRGVMDASGTVQYLEGIIFDISDRKYAQLELEEAKAAAEAADRTKSEFLANMSHEIRTPMTSVLGFTSLLQAASLDPKQRRFVEAIERNGQVLLRIINDILDLSKLEARELALTTATFDLQKLLDELGEMFQPQMLESGLTFAVAIAPDVPLYLEGSAQHLQQVLINLIRNAVKFTDSGSIEVMVACDREPALNNDEIRLYFHVQDSGIGIAVADQAKLFEPFTQVDNSTTRAHGGTGLGLAICHKIVQLCGGEIGVRSQLGAGATFWFTLAFARPSAAAIAALKATNAVAPELPAAIAATNPILVVEDDPNNSEVLLELLSSLGYEADFVGNGQAAVERLAAFNYSLILMDCQMPVLDGYEATRAIRAREVRLHQVRTPIVGVTAHAMMGDREKCLAAGMDDYLSKPIQRPDLAVTIGRWLDQTAEPAAD